MPETNLEKRKVYNARYRETHRAYFKQYRENNKEHIYALQRQSVERKRYLNAFEKAIKQVEASRLLAAKPETDRLERLELARIDADRYRHPDTH
jgi:hypothetical protein